MNFNFSNLVHETQSYIPNKSVSPEKCNGEKSLFNKLTALLSGIPPPPSIATSKLTCTQMLESIKLNIDILELKNIDSPLKECNPRVFYLNQDILSEEIADLTMKLQGRFVQSETSSSYSIQANIDRQLSNSARKRRQWNGISPGRRLSHLAKRRQMFSKANLQQLSKNEPKVHKIAISKPSAQRNLAKEYLEYKDNTSKDRSLPKRALFQSPEDDVLPGFRTVARNVPRRKLFEKPERSVQLPPGGGSYDVSGWLATQPFMGGKKRSREESRDSDRKRRCPRRSLDFSDGSPSQCSNVSAISNGVYQVPAPSVSLTEVQKQKLLWAVASVLKEKKITHKDSCFKKCAGSLFSICKKNLPIIQSIAMKSGTSEKMLTFARSKVNEIIKEFNHKSEPIPTTSKSSGILNDLSLSTLNKKQIDSQSSNVMDGKENVSKTPKRRIKIRQWQTSIKQNNKRKSRLNKSLSFDDLREMNENQLNVNINGPVFKFCINSPLKITTPAKRKYDEAFNLTNNSTNTNCDNRIMDCIIMETPEKFQNQSDCVPGSQEEIETHNFPALTRKLCVESKSFCERSPDLFEQDDEYANVCQDKTDSKSIIDTCNPNQDLETIENLNCNTEIKENCLDISSVPLESNLLPIELPEIECEENDDLFVDKILINNELLSSAVILETNIIPDEKENLSFLDFGNLVGDKKVLDEESLAIVPENDLNTDVGEILDLNETYEEVDIIHELPSLFTEVALNENHLSPLQFKKENINTTLEDSVKQSNFLDKEVNIETTLPGQNAIGYADNDTSLVHIVSANLEIPIISENNCTQVSLLSEQEEVSSKSESESDGGSCASIELSAEDNLTIETNGKPEYSFLNESKGEFSIIKKSNEDSYVDVVGDDDDKASSNVYTSTPRVEFSKKLMIKSKPAWRLEAGPGLKIRMRLSKDWDIVGRNDSRASDTSELVSYDNNIDIDMEAKPAKTQIENSLLRKICTGESSGTSMDSYTLTEMRDRLAIEKTLAAENSDLSLFESTSEISSCSENDDDNQNIEILRNVNLNYSKDLEGHTSFESIIESAILERQQVSQETDCSSLKTTLGADTNPDLSHDLHQSATFNENSKHCLVESEFSTQNFNAMRSSLVDNEPIIQLGPESSKPELPDLSHQTSSVLNVSNVSTELLDIVSDVDESKSNILQEPFASLPLMSETSATIMNVASITDEIVNVISKKDSSVMRQSFNDDDNVPLIKLLPELSETSLNATNISRDQTDEIDKNIEFSVMPLIDDDDVPLIQFVPQLSETSLNTVNMSLEKTDEIVSNNEFSAEPLIDDEDVPLIQFVPQLSETSLNTVNISLEKTDEIVSNNEFSAEPLIDDEDVPLIQFVPQLSETSLNTVNISLEKTDEIVSNNEFSAEPLIDDEDVPLIKLVPELSETSLNTVNISLKKNDEIVSNNEFSAEPLIDYDNVPSMRLVPEISETSFNTVNISREKLDEIVSNSEFSVKQLIDDDDVPLIQFVSESSRSAIANLHQLEPSITDTTTPSVENIFDDKSSSKLSLDEDVPVCLASFPIDKIGVTEIDDLHKNKTNVMRPSIDDDLPLIFLLPESSTKNNLLHNTEPLLTSQETSDNDELRDLGESDDDIPLSQLADNSTCTSKISNIEHNDKDDDSLPLIQLLNNTGNCDIVNNHENYDAAIKYDLLLNQLNQSVLTEKNDENNLLDVSSLISSSETEDLPLCNLISQNSNDNKMVSDGDKYFKRQTSEEDENTPLIKLSKLINPQKNIIDNKNLDCEVRHFKEISVIKNKLESNYDEENLNKTNLKMAENNYLTPSKESIVSDCTTDSRLIPMSAGSDASTGRSKTKLSLESYKARKKLVLEPNIEDVSPPKKIYNIRLKKKEKHYKKRERRRTSVLDTSSENWDDECLEDKFLIDKAKTFVNAFSTISCIVDQEMKLTVSAIADDKERERKLRKLSDVSEMSDSILQTFFDQIPQVKSIFKSQS